MGVQNDPEAAVWVRRHAPQWQRLAAETATAARRTHPSVEQALQTLGAYRTLARHLATVRSLLPGSLAAAALERTCAQLHTAVNRPARFGRAGWMRMLREDVPAAAAAVRVTALWLAMLLAVSTFAGWWLVSRHPELVSLIASPQMIDGVEHGHLWTYQILTLGPPALLSARIFSNNVMVTLGAFCFGTLFGLGAFYMIAFNGLMLGGLLAFTHQHGLGLGLLKFTLAHGPVELSVMCLAAAAGTALGEALIRPGEFSRGEALRRRTAQLGPLLLACALLLLGSGLIEGFVSPRPQISIPVRLGIGLGYWTLMMAWLSGRLFPRTRRPVNG